MTANSVIDAGQAGGPTRQLTPKGIRGFGSAADWMDASAPSAGQCLIGGTYRPALHADAVALLTPHATTIAELHPGQTCADGFELGGVGVGTGMFCLSPLQLGTVHGDRSTPAFAGVLRLTWLALPAGRAAHKTRSGGYVSARYHLPRG